MRRDRGFALVWAMLLVVLVGALGSVVLERDRTVRRDAATDLEAVASFHAAEGGLAWARHALAADPAWPGGARRVGACEVAVEVATAGEGAWRVVAGARPGASVLEARVARRDGRVVLLDWRERP